MKNDLVSIIIPTWNREKTILRSVESVLKQTHKNIEVLVCDDGSTDNSKIKVLNLKDKRIRWVEGVHAGMPATPRNSGVEIAKGKWIAFLDSDDWWVEDKLEKQLGLMKLHRGLISSTNAIRVKSVDGSEQDFIKKNNVLRKIKFIELFDVNNLVTSSVVVKSDLLKDLRFNENRKMVAVEDYLLWLELSLSKEILYIPDKLVFYNDDELNSVRKDGLTWPEQKKQIEKELISWSLKKDFKLYCKVMVLILMSKVSHLLNGDI